MFKPGLIESSAVPRSCALRRRAPTRGFGLARRFIVHRGSRLAPSTGMTTSTSKVHRRWSRNTRATAPTGHAS